MECPKCQARMTLVNYGGVEVDRCVRCGGLWFDRSESEALSHQPGAESIDSGPAWQAPMHNEQGKVFCPVDGTLMVRREDEAHPGLLLDGCPRCRGTFFDAGEFTDFKEQTLAELIRKPPPAT